MSMDLYPVRLYWAGMKGVARGRGREVRLQAPPHLPNLAIEAIDYAPGVVAMVMPRFCGWRDMEVEECAAARAALEQILAGATES